MWASGEKGDRPTAALYKGERTYFRNIEHQHTCLTIKKRKLEETRASKIKVQSSIVAQHLLDPTKKSTPALCQPIQSLRLEYSFLAFTHKEKLEAMLVVHVGQTRNCGCGDCGHKSAVATLHLARIELATFSVRG